MQNIARDVSLRLITSWMD